MITKIVLENFMSHSRTVIEPAACLTVLTGPNNCGKSAVVAALQTICGNERGSFMVRHGQKESRVVVETDEGHAVEWRRKGATVSYVVNSREVHRGVPEDLHDVLRLPKVESREGKDEFDVHFGEQKRPIFLVGEPGSQAATFFASSSDAEYLVRMQSLHRQRTTERRGKERDLKQSIARLDQSLAVLGPLEALEARVAAVEAMHRECVAGADGIDLLARQLVELRALASDYAAAEAASRCLDPLVEPPELATADRLSQHADEIRVCRSAHLAAKAHAEALVALAEPPVLLPDGSLRDDVGVLVQAQVKRAGLERRVKALEALIDVPQLADDGGLLTALTEVRSTRQIERVAALCYDAVDRLIEPPSLADEAALRVTLVTARSADTDLARATARMQKVEMLPELPEFVDVSQVETAAAELRNTERECRLAAEDLGKVHEAAQAVRTEIEIWVALNPTCPVCGGDFDPGRILGEPEAAVG